MPDCISDERIARFRVAPWLDWFGGHVARRATLWRRLGNWETRLLATEIAEIKIAEPVFICGLARSGSTILLESLAAHPETATHRYRDYPGVLAPVFWDRFSARLYANHLAPVERAHGDGIAVTPDSPEAIEEMLWMAFHPQSHDSASDNRLDLVSPDFAAFYRDHIRKLLWLRQGRRYLAKGNYNLVRLRAILQLFPDARIIIPLRDPLTHIASLMRQHALFSAAEVRHPAALRYMQRVGHYEFGLDRRALNLGSVSATTAIQKLWRDGNEVEGWSLYWASVHDFVAEQLHEDRAVRKAALLVRFEELCADAEGTLTRILNHAHLESDKAWIAATSRHIRAPSSGPPPFTEAQYRKIRQITASAAQRLGIGQR